jgi:hypothetical protein
MYICPYYMQNNYDANREPYMRNDQYSQMGSPESTMPEFQLSTMYPKTYNIIYPHVIKHCDMFDKSCCSMKIPTSEEIKQMAETISMQVEPEVEASIESGMREYEVGQAETRQLGFAGRGLLRDFVGTLLLREFFERRHRPHHFFPQHHFPMHHMGY